jgi:RimJ/RimL family protein N-acetyltransferase
MSTTADAGLQVPPTSLSDGVVTLRPWAAGDAAALYEAARESIDSVGPWLSWLDALYAPADAERWVTTSQQHWRLGTEFRFGIRDAVHDRLLGGAGVNHVDRTHGFGNLGYWVRSGAVGRGVATRATRLVARFGLTTAGLGRIEILTATDNFASQRVADKAGATFEGVLRDRLLVRGRRIPARLYSLVAHDLGGG